MASPSAMARLSTGVARFRGGVARFGGESRHGSSVASLPSTRVAMGVGLGPAAGLRFVLGDLAGSGVSEVQVARVPRLRFPFGARRGSVLASSDLLRSPSARWPGLQPTSRAHSGLRAAPHRLLVSTLSGVARAAASPAACGDAVEIGGRPQDGLWSRTEAQRTELHREEPVANRLASLLPGIGALAMTLALVGLGTWFARPAPEPAGFDLNDALVLWDGGPGGRSALRTALTNPEDQVLVVRALLDRARSADPGICTLLDNADSKQWCESTMHRPHLYEQKQQAVPRRTRAGGGPVDLKLLPTRSIPSLATPTPAPACASGTEPHACAATLARQHARTGDIEAAASACHHIEAGRWRDECVFAAAEATHSAGGDDWLGPATRLCAEASRFQSHCLSHVVTAAATRTPSADSGSGWTAVSARAEQLRTTWTPLDPTLGELLVARFYAEALDQAYARARTLTGLPFAKLPPEAHPHVRASAVDRLVQSESNPNRSVAARVEQASSILSQTTPLPDAPQLEPNPIRAHTIQDLWTHETADEASLPATFWRGEARRMVSEDPEHELIVCVLESLARTREPPGQRIESFRDHDDPAVRATARRLAQNVRAKGQRR